MASKKENLLQKQRTAPIFWWKSQLTGRGQWGVCGKSLPRHAPGANVKQQALRYWFLSLGSLMEAKMAVGGGCLRKLVVGWASLGALEESTSSRSSLLVQPRKRLALQEAPPPASWNKRLGSKFSKDLSKLAYWSWGHIMYWLKWQALQSNSWIQVLRISITYGYGTWSKFLRLARP